MERFEKFVLLFFLFIFICTLCLAEYESSAKKYSILVSGKDGIGGRFGKYNAFLGIESVVLSNAAILQGYVPLRFEEMPSESVQEIAAENFENPGNSTEELQGNDLVSVDAVKSTLPSQDILSDIVAELPFGSWLSISVKKLAGFNYTARVYDKEKDGKRKNTSFLKMEQELQMKIFGSIKDRLNIDVDYDDTSGKKDISFVYKGQPGEFVQEAAFGDISVLFANTEFMEYSKELFGLKVDMRYKTLGLNTFFSKTKGMSEIKRFTGNTQLERRVIVDTSYIKLRYYSLLRSAETRTIENGSVEVYIDYQKLDPAYNISIASTVLYSLNRADVSYRGNFVRLVAGQDYTVDYNTGVLVFKNTLASNCAVAVNYKFTDGSTPGNGPLIIKDVNNTVAVTTELKTFYDLGNLNIIRDNGRDNFLLEIRNLNDDIPLTIERGKDVPAYPPKAGYGANIAVDFENGVFHLSQPLHDDLYLKGTSKYRFIAEYQYTIKTLALRPGIIPKSEKVVVDGMTLKSESDYVIDYDTGILTVKNENVIKETSVLDVSYDYSTIIGSQGEATLIGASSRFNLTDNISLGAGILYNFMAAGAAVPDIRNVPASLVVGGVDVKIADLDIDALNMKINAEAEYALSVQNINTSNKAIIDSMDSSVCEDLTSMLDENWFHSANGGYCMPRKLDDLSWKSYEICLRDIDPSLEFVDEQKQLVLELNYDVRDRSQVAFAQKLSLDGCDFSKKLYIDVWIQDNNLSSPEFIIDYASCINEDADGNGILDTEDADGDGILSPWEDTGQKFHNIDGTVSLIGAHNGKLDTEDLNGNGILDTLEEVAGSYSISSGTVIKTNVNGWRQIRIPLNITDDNISKWKNIRILRFSVQKKSGERGKIVIGKIAISGNRWERIGMNLDNFSISAIGKFDPEYKSLLSNKHYLDLYDIEDTVRKDERALKIAYNAISSGETFLAKSVYAEDPLDISKYKSIKFMVYAKPESKYAAVGDVIIFRAGGNDSNYFEYRIPVTDDSSWQDWKLITIEQDGIGRLASWSSLDSSAKITVYGNPSLDRISQFVIGVESSQVGMNHQVWFNEIHVVGSKVPRGAANKVGCSLQWKGAGIIDAISVGASRKSIDKNFQTIAAGAYNRDYSEDSAYFNFDGLKINKAKILPLKTGISRIETMTPKIDEKKSNLISLNEKGQVVTYTGYAETNLKIGDKFPHFTIRYSRSIIDNFEIKRLEDKEIFSETVVYDNPLEFAMLPTSISADARTVNSYYKVYPSVPVARSNSFLGLDSMKEYLDIKQYHTLERSNIFAIKLPFKFSRGITFSPSYVINVVKEKNNDFKREIEYDKTLNQTIGASFVLGLADWFNPAFTYSVNTKENYYINASNDASSLFIPGQEKYIERKGIGEISWNLNACDITSSPFFKSLAFSTYYRLQDSDSYDSVDKGFQSTGLTMGKFWIRNSPLMDLQPFYPTDSYVVKTILNTDDMRFSGKYMPFEAFSFAEALSPLNTVSVNCTYTGSSDSSYITGMTGTKKNVYTRVWPEILIGMSGVERFFGAGEWMLDTQFNFKYHNKVVTTYGVSYCDSVICGFDYRFKFLKIFNLYFAFENTSSSELDYASSKILPSPLSKKYVGQCAFDLNEWKFSLKYESENRWQKNAFGKYASDVYKDTYLGQIKFDMIFPSGIKIPVVNKVLPFKNRIAFLSDFRCIDQKSKADVEKDNNINFGISVNVDYEISKYCRFLLGVNLDRFKYRCNADLNYYDISLISKLTIHI
ncbi:MAG: hypothetical protein LBU33_02205 [Endomicrobium sp.]|jgi:hypothetical protein|nr:hypothetical protein [Endomicrobium sp.]